MRAGGSSVLQQSLTPDSSAMVKQAVSLARRRGHAQVTPLHVATAMLSIPAGLLRSACLESHAQTHPLRCKALDLCFNVALNRLPSSSQILMGPYRAHQPPSLSNALIAAFKRAQAHQRRGPTVDAQQQPMITVRIDIEQLIISILDDPSVSRVMREAGFSSTQVKANVKKAVSLELASPPNPNPNPNPNTNIKNVDLMTVVEALMTKQKRSIVIIGECLNSSDGMVRSLMDGVKKGEVVMDLRSLQFITLSLLAFEKMSREEVEEKVPELRCVVRSCRIGRGVVLYLGDLKGAADHWVSCRERGEGMYCAIERVVKEIAMLVNGDGDDVWLMAIATHQTYSSCRIGNPSLESLWGLQPLTIPAVSLDLSLNNDSLHSQLRSKRISEERPCWPPLEDGIRIGLTSSSVLPLLQSERQESTRPTITNLVSLHVNDQYKLDSTLNSHYKQHPSLQQTLNFSSVSPSASSPSDCDPNSTSSIETIELEYIPRFKELNAENLKTLYNLLEKLSCQKEIIPNLASIILQCRSGMVKRKEWSKIKEETWLCFLGTDAESKEKISRGIAELIFGSQTNFISIGLNEFSLSSDPGSKRSRIKASHGFLQRLACAIQDNPHRVILLEDVERADHESQRGILNAISRGMIQSSIGEDVSVSDTIIILSCESSSFDLTSRVCSPPVKQKFNSDEDKEKACDEGISSSAGFDLNVDAVCEDVDLSINELGLLEAVDSTFVFKCSDEMLH